MTKQKEFEKLAGKIGSLIKLKIDDNEYSLWLLGVEGKESDCAKLWSWIENEIRQAKIEENRKWIQDAFNCGALNIQLIDVRSRISELEKEKL